MVNGSLIHKYILEVEKYHDDDITLDSFRKAWHYSIYLSVGYLVVIFSVQNYMRRRQPLELRLALITWNFCQSLVTAFLLSRTLPEFMEAVRLYGWQKTFCGIETLTRVSLFWSVIYTYSKVWDLFDTLFIVLRKRPLTFLHVIHHVVTLIFACFFRSRKFAFSLFIAVINTSIHVIMYSYYTAKALNYKVPQKISMAITILQLLQMLAVLIGSLFVAKVLSSGEECFADYTCCFLSTFASSLYFFLFGNFFIKTYFLKKKTKYAPQCKGAVTKDE